MEVSASTVSDWLKGVKRPRAEMINRLHSVILNHGFTHISRAQLFHEAGVDMPPDPIERLIANVQELSFSEETKQRIIELIKIEESRHRNNDARDKVS
jgi:transcriptional regulator with XRE-family HTH domain